MTYGRDGEHTIVPVQLPAAGSQFVVFHAAQERPSITRIERNGTVLVDATKINKYAQSEPESAFGLSTGEPLQPWVETPFLGMQLIERGARLLAWEDGAYRFTKSDETTQTINITGCKKMAVAGPWTLSFPRGWGAPGQLDLPSLKPWSALEDAAVQAFSGTASYQSTMDIDQIDADSRFLIDLGRVADIAEIWVNDKRVTTLWAPPFRVDITGHVTVGSNRIEIKVTNTWHNRLVYEASLKPNQRKTWTLAGPARDDPLESAGILGPVAICVGKVAKIDVGTP